MCWLWLIPVSESESERSRPPTLLTMFSRWIAVQAKGMRKRPSLVHICSAWALNFSSFSLCYMYTCTKIKTTESFQNIHLVVTQTLCKGNGWAAFIVPFQTAQKSNLATERTVTDTGSSIYWTLLILKINKYCSSPDQVEKSTEDTIIMPDVSDEMLMQKPSRKCSVVPWWSLIPSWPCTAHSIRRCLPAEGLSPAETHIQQSLTTTMYHLLEVSSSNQDCIYLIWCFSFNIF